MLSFGASAALLTQQKIEYFQILPTTAPPHDKLTDGVEIFSKKCFFFMANSLYSQKQALASLWDGAAFRVK